MARATPRRTRSRAAPARRAVSSEAERRPTPPHRPLPEEEPHAHIVCRGCGRIQGLELTELDVHFLTQLAERRPDGWSVERIAFSVAGACQRCREGAVAP